MKIHTIWVADHLTYSTEMHTHDHYQLIYCKNTAGLIHISGTDYHPAAGQVFFLRPMVPHLIQRGNNLRAIEIKFLAEGSETIERLRHLPEAFFSENDLSLRMSLKDIVREGLSHLLYCNESTNAAMELMLIRLLREFIKLPGESLNTYSFTALGEMRTHAGDSLANADFQFVKLAQYIETHLSDPLTLDDLSALMHFNKSYLVERFKDIWGMPPMKFVNWIRLEKARELLTSTNKSVTSIAQETGFHSIHYFSRYFKTKEGITPQRYRQCFQKDVYTLDKQDMGRCEDGQEYNDL